ncbi:Uncharacterized protein HZ326_20775 [Fusarium oxysporum f. sp. albedinis]|nr:Uncharacterized protein HZ326_20775 [Fusarium oxysporum f. sp. albedinis]
MFVIKSVIITIWAKEIMFSTPCQPVHLTCCSKSYVFLVTWSASPADHGLDRAESSTKTSRTRITQSHVK